MGIIPIGHLDTWMSDRRSSSKNDTRTAEGNENVNGQVELESFRWGKKWVIAGEWQASQGKPLAEWSMTGRQCLESVEHGEHGECAMSRRMRGKTPTRVAYTMLSWWISD
jgi:hypothetical protein